MRSKTYIIIVSYNGLHYLEECLRSCDGYSVVIVDNASTDKTLEYIESNYPTITLLKQTKNLGFGQANNLGISYALEKGAKYVFLLNQDAYLQKNTLELLVETQKRNKDFGIVSPIHLNGKGDRLDQNFSNYMSYGNNPDFYSDFVLNKELKEIYEVPFVNAAGWLLSKKILETVGGFDPIFFHYGEDDNYCQRARFHNFKIGVVPNVFLRHDREDRKNPTLNAEENFLRRERSLKNLYGDISKDNLGDLEHLLKKRKKEYIKLFLKFKFKKLASAQKEIVMIADVLEAVSQSKIKNKEVGMHYL